MEKYDYNGALKYKNSYSVMDEEEKLQRELDALVKEHQELDTMIKDLVDGMVSDQLRIQRLKKRKLWLKDRISQLQEYLYPDIIA